VNKLMEFYGKFIAIAQILPAYIKMPKIKEKEKEFM